MGGEGDDNYDDSHLLSPNCVPRAVLHTSYTLVYITLTITLFGIYYYYHLHFIHEETQTQGPNNFTVMVSPGLLIKFYNALCLKAWKSQCLFLHL